MLLPEQPVKKFFKLVPCGTETMYFPIAENRLSFLNRVNIINSKLWLFILNNVNNLL